MSEEPRVIRDAQIQAISLDVGASVFPVLPPELIEQVMQYKPGPDQVVVMPACEAHGSGHVPDCTEHGWALVDPYEDDPPFLETPYLEVAVYVAELWNADHEEDPA